MSTASSAVGIRPGSLRAWVLAARPATLAVAVVPVLVGTAIAHAMHHARIGPALAALLGAMWIQIGTNFANDVFDYEKGADTEERLGPVRATQAGLLDARAMRIGMIASFALATFAGTYLLAVAGWPVFVIGIVSIASGIAYTGGPYPLGYNGLGDLFVFVFFGFVAVCGTVFVQTASVPWMAIAASIPVGALATAILVVNNVRDGATDVKAGNSGGALRPRVRRRGIRGAPRAGVRGPDRVRRHASIAVAAPGARHRADRSVARTHDPPRNGGPGAQRRTRTHRETSPRARRALRGRHRALLNGRRANQGDAARSKRGRTRQRASHVAHA